MAANIQTMGMAKPKKPKAHRVAPSAWSDAVRAHWQKITELGVEVRHGARGSWRPLGNPIAKTEVDGRETDQRFIPAGEYAQTLYDRAWDYRDECDVMVDSQIVGYIRDSDGLQRVFEEGSGGRLLEDASEDIPESEAHGFAVVWKAASAERKDLVEQVGKLAKTVVKLAESVEGILDRCSDLLKEDRRVRVAEAEAAASAYRADRAAEVAEKTVTQWADPLKTWAAARYQEATNKRRRAPVGDAVIDAWRDLSEVVDLSVAAHLRSRLGDRWAPLEEAFGHPEVFTREQILELWRAHVRGKVPEDEWREMLSAVPSIVRERLVNLAAQIQAAESVGGPA